MTPDDVDDADPVAVALDAVDVDGSPSPGEGSPSPDGEPSPSPSADPAAVPDSEGSASPSTELRQVSPLKQWLQRVPEGSHLDFELGHWWDPETGGERRVAFHASDLGPRDGVGYPNGVGVLVGLLEIYYRRAFGGDRDGAGADRADDVDGALDEPDVDGREELSREEADRYV